MKSQPVVVSGAIRKLLAQHQRAIARGGVLSPLQHSLRWLAQAVERRRALVEHGVPPILVEAETLAIREALLAVESHRAGRGLAWKPLELWSAPRVGQPPRERPFAAVGMDPALPIALAFLGDDVVAQTSSELLHLDPATGKFTREPLGLCDLAGTSGDGARLLFKCGPDLRFAVYDARGKWVASLAGFPAVHVASAISRSISLVDLRQRLEASTGGLDLGDACDFVLSPDSRWLWGRIRPGHDTLGILDVERGCPAFDPWPRARSKGNDWYDPTLRALVRTGEGAFRLLYGSKVFEGQRQVGSVRGRYSAACFDLQGGRLALANAKVLRVFQLDGRGRPRAAQVVDLTPMLASGRVREA